MTVQVLQQYANVKHRDKLRCNAAFFMGLLRQVLDSRAGRRQASVLVVPKPPAPPPCNLSPDASRKLTELYRQGMLDPGLMGPCMGLLAALPKSAQLGAVVTIAMDIDSAQNKQAFVVQTLKGMHAAASSAGAIKPHQPHIKPGSGSADSRFISNTGKIINPNEVSIRLNPSSAFYDPDLTMCWRVLTKHDKANWQMQIANGQRPKLSSLSLPRQQLAEKLHPGQPHYDNSTAAAWKHTDAAEKEMLLLDADTTGRSISIAEMQRQPQRKPDPKFEEMDFPPLDSSSILQNYQASGTDAALSSTASIATAGRHPQTDTSMKTKSSAEELEAMPLHQMGMAFKSSFSLRDMMKADASIAAASQAVSSHGQVSGSKPLSTQ